MFSRFTRAIVRPPARTFADGLTTVDLGTPDVDRALAQHRDYCDALVRHGVQVLALDIDERYPDSTFVEDTALILPHRGAFAGHDVVRVPVGEEYGANCVRVNDVVFVSAGQPQLDTRLRTLGYTLEVLEMSEYRKMDGGLSCLSLRF